MTDYKLKMNVKDYWRKVGCRPNRKSKLRSNSVAYFNAVRLYRQRVGQPIDDASVKNVCVRRFFSQHGRILFVGGHAMYGNVQGLNMNKTEYAIP